MTLRARLRRSLPWTIAVAGGFLAAYLLIAFVVFPSGLIPRDVRVPNVIGLGFDDAGRRLAQRGLRGVRGEERFHAASPKGTVLEQSPQPNAQDVEGGTVTLVTSAGQRSASVPSVVGMPRDSAERVIEDAGFEIGQVVERPDRAPAGQVLDSRPPAGAAAPVSSAVALIVSAGDATVPVPDVTGRRLRDARAVLERAGLAVGDVSILASAVRSPADSNGVVALQDPGAGTRVSRGSRVSLQLKPQTR